MRVLRPPGRKSRGRGCGRAHSASVRDSQQKGAARGLQVLAPWSRQLCIALCRRYGINPFRYARMPRQTVMLRAPARFMNVTPWPEVEELSRALATHPDDNTRRIMREEVHEATRNAEGISNPRPLR